MDNLIEFPHKASTKAEVNLTSLVTAMIDLNRDMKDLKYAQQRNRFHINLLIKALKVKGMLSDDT